MLDPRSDNIIQIAVIFLLYLFIAVIAYFLLSTPIELILSSFEGIEAGEATNELNRFLPFYKTAMTVFWALFIAAPVTWLVMKVFSREPAWYHQRRF